MHSVKRGFASSGMLRSAESICSTLAFDTRQSPISARPFPFSVSMPPLPSNVAFAVRVPSIPPLACASSISFLTCAPSTERFVTYLDFARSKLKSPLAWPPPTRAVSGASFTASRVSVSVPFASRRNSNPAMATVLMEASPWPEAPAAVTSNELLKSASSIAISVAFAESVRVTRASRTASLDSSSVRGIASLTPGATAAGFAGAAAPPSFS